MTSPETFQPQAADGHMLSPAPCARRPGSCNLDLLPEDLDGIGGNGGDRADDLAVHGDRLRDEPGGIHLRHGAHDMADPQVASATQLPVDHDRDFRAIGDAPVVHDNAAKALDRSDEAGAADPAIAAALPLRREAGAADVDVARPLRGGGRRAQRRSGCPQRSENGPAGRHGARCHACPLSSPARPSRSRKT